MAQTQQPDTKELQELVDWQSIQAAVKRLFQLKRFPELATELPTLNDKLSKLSRSEVGPFIGDFYQNQILTRCMIILRQELAEKKGNSLLLKLKDTWTQFYTSILPTLMAIFAPVQLKYLSIRALTLLSFRDVVLLKTDIKDALMSHSNSDHGPIPAPIHQMLLVLQSVHRTPPTEQFFLLQSLVGKVVRPYLPMVPQVRGASGKSPSESPQGNNEEDSLGSRYNRAETVSGDLDGGEKTVPSSSGDGGVKRRHSLGHLDKEKSGMGQRTDNDTPT